ncbi:hypothetical protein YTPLAS18_21820 [Nitrospira sp.]|nr:hypothetical protein YTPLAS18_21820 [Nitrospira sp.]
MRWLSAGWRRRLKWSELIVVLALLTACLAMGVSYFLRTYYGHNANGYEPFDTQREQQMQKSSTGH